MIIPPAERGSAPFILLFLSTLAVSTVAEGNLSTPLVLGREEPQTPACGFVGQSDLYGLGIRVGIYLQWIIGLAVHRFYPEGYADAAVTCLSFSTAITVAVVVNSSGRYAAEILIFLYLFWSGMFILFLLNEHNIVEGNVKDGTTVLRLILAGLLLTAGALYSGWFWFKGLHESFLPTPCTGGDSETYGLVFKRVSLYDPGVYKALGALSIVAVVLLLLENLIVFYTFRKAESLISRYDKAMRNTSRGPPTANLELVNRLVRQGVYMNTYPRLGGVFETKTRFKFIGLEFDGRSLMPIVGLFVFAHSVVGIELTLYWNHITDVYDFSSIGQLIPFVISVEEILRFTYRAVRQRYERR